MSEHPAGGEITFVVEAGPEGGLTARALGEPIVTRAETMDALRVMVQEAVRAHFGAGREPTTIRLHRKH